MSSNKSPWNNKYKQGYYKVINESKYIGDISNIKYRSSYELFFSRYLDNNPKILKWACEQPVIMYKDLRGKSHRYYIDFYYEMMVDNDPNKFERVIVEVKPHSDLFPPKKPKNPTAKALQNYEYAVQMHIKNKLKWAAAEEYAQKHKYKFVIVTENTLRKAGIMN